MRTARDPSRVIRSAISVNQWLLRTPTVDEVRPVACPVCGAASRPAGGLLGVYGHGLRSRQLRGPLSPEAPPSDSGIQARRYSCQHCPAILSVVPCETLPRRHYAATAIAFALGLYGLAGESHAEVRSQVSTAKVIALKSERRWITLSRWIDAVADRTLFTSLPAMPSDRGRREVAGRAAMALSARAPPSLQTGALAARAFLGAAHMP